jgi:MoaA/NifB/PqqE/SkfB family radical SAM enzyme
MSEQDWENIIDQAAVLGCRALQFIGGEPTMHPALPALIERARVRGFETVEVYTNGTMFHPRVKEAFIRHRVDLAFSVYAASPEIHDRVTQRRGVSNEPCNQFGGRLKRSFRSVLALLR